MVWKNFSIRNARNVLKTKRVVITQKEEPYLKPLYVNDYVYSNEELLGIRTKPSFMDRIQNKLRRKGRKKYSRFRTIFDNSVLKSDPMGRVLFKKKRFLRRRFFRLSFAIEPLSKNYCNLYLQSKMNEGIDSYKKMAIDLIDPKKIEMGLPSLFQLSQRFNKFYREINYKTLLFRSFWFSKFISTLVINGKKQRIWTAALEVFSSLKFEFGRNPVMLLFEILELYRMPLKALQPKNKTRKSIIRTHIISWWKQYTQLLRWVRHSIKGPVKTTSDWKIKFKKEIFDLIKDNPTTLIKKRIELNSQMISFSKVSIHFRWYKRYSKRAVSAIKIVDRRYYV